jgi:hypothetical protein
MVHPILFVQVIKEISRKFKIYFRKQEAKKIINKILFIIIYNIKPGRARCKI